MAGVDSCLSWSSMGRDRADGGWWWMVDGGHRWCGQPSIERSSGNSKASPTNTKPLLRSFHHSTTHSQSLTTTTSTSPHHPTLQLTSYRTAQVQRIDSQITASCPPTLWTTFVDSHIVVPTSLPVSLDVFFFPSCPLSFCLWRFVHLQFGDV